MRVRVKGEGEGEGVGEGEGEGEGVGEGERVRVRVRDGGRKVGMVREVRRGVRRPCARGVREFRGVKSAVCMCAVCIFAVSIFARRYGWPVRGLTFEDGSRR